VTDSAKEQPKMVLGYVRATICCTDSGPTQSRYGFCSV